MNFSHICETAHRQIPYSILKKYLIADYLKTDTIGSTENIGEHVKKGIIELSEYRKRDVFKNNITSLKEYKKIADTLNAGTECMIRLFQAHNKKSSGNHAS